MIYFPVIGFARNDSWLPCLTTICLLSLTRRDHWPTIDRTTRSKRWRTVPVTSARPSNYAWTHVVTKTY